MIKSKSNLTYIVTLILLMLPAVWNLFQQGYFFMHDDLQVMRLFQMEECFRGGQIPCRWVPDMGAGYGFPLFNFYSPLPYYLGMIFRLFGVSYIWTAKLLFTTSLLVSGLFMYLLTKEFVGKVGGLVAGVLYVYVPYHAVQIYVRGALGEAWGAMFFPLILWCIYKFIREKKLSYFVLSVVSVSLLLLSHNLMSLVFLPVALVWAIMWLVVGKDIKKTIVVGLIFVWAIGLSAFFVLPAFFEKSFVSIDNLVSDYFNYELHYANIRQLFLDRTWGYGPSFPGPDDRLSFQLGWPHWWMVVLGTIVFVYVFTRRKKKLLLPLGFGIGLFFAAAFMAHSRSFYIWKFLPLLGFIQFPWRFLAVAMFASSFVAGLVVGAMRMKAVFAVTLIGLTLILNLGYFKPKEFYTQMTDDIKLSGEQFENQSKAAIQDYLPRAVDGVPTELAPKSPKVIKGEAEVSRLNIRSDFWHFDADVYNQDGAEIEVPIFDFPNWQVVINGTPVDHSVSKPLGLIKVTLPKGKNIVVGWFENTQLRLIANAITMVSFIGLLLLIIYKDWNEKSTDK